MDAIAGVYILDGRPAMDVEAHARGETSSHPLE
jgi:hypothetical protein